MSVAEIQPLEDFTSSKVTARLAEWTAELRYADLTESARTWSRHALLDWAGVALAAARDPLVEILADELVAESTGTCTLVGRGQTADKHTAALINGSASHALDYDDVAAAMHGHPTVPVAPAILALGESLAASGPDIITAFVAGVQVECRLGAMTDSSHRAESSHYEQGFHATGTLGAFGAAAAAARLMGLDGETTARALGLAASQGAGLKCNFGTMTKPFHAGKAAANGLLAARLAARGFTARTNAIEAKQGFAFSQIPEFTPCDPEPGHDGIFEVERTLFKYHAACYSTHATLNGLGELRDGHGIGIDDVEKVTLFVNPRVAGNCNNPDPKTGLDLKFSIRQLAALGLDDADTGALATYCTENATDPRFTALREKTDLVFEPHRDRMTSGVKLTLKNGRVLETEADVGTPAGDLDHQWQRLTGKFTSLASPVIGAERTQTALQEFADLEDCADITTVMACIR